ncbi:hypothetical protein CXB38_20035 [Pseudomonas syringae]|nr:hypothetical protein CXB38_20035 [Pseudomonas syringae]
MLHAEAQTAPPQTLCRRVADSTGSWPLRDIYLLYTAVSRKRWRHENSAQPGHGAKAGPVPACNVCILR